MSTSSLTWTEGTTQVAGVDLHFAKGGSGEPLLVLHDEMGQEGVGLRRLTIPTGTTHNLRLQAGQIGLSRSNFMSKFLNLDRLK